MASSWRWTVGHHDPPALELVQNALRLDQQLPVEAGSEFRHPPPQVREFAKRRRLSSTRCRRRRAPRAEGAIYSRRSVNCSISRKLRLLRESTARLWRNYRSMLLVAVTLAGVAGTLSSALQWRNAIVVNKEISALRAGHIRRSPLTPSRGSCLLGSNSWRNATKLMGAGAHGRPGPRRTRDLSATGRYTLANALLHGRSTSSNEDSRRAGPFVNLSKREYRRALQLAPSYWTPNSTSTWRRASCETTPTSSRKTGTAQAEPRNFGPMCPRSQGPP